MRIKFQVRLPPAEVFPWEHAGPRLSIGRLPECDLSFCGAMGEIVSGRHALIELSRSGAVLTDLGSTNGTFVNGVRLTRPAVLEVGDQIALGREGPRLDVLLIEAAAAVKASGNVLAAEIGHERGTSPPSNVLWYYAKANGEQRFGPISLEELRSLVSSGAIGPSDLVWKPGFDSWVAASTIEKLSLVTRGGEPASSVPSHKGSSPGMPPDVAYTTQPHASSPPFRDSRYAESSSDPPGVISLICGILALVCIVLGCLACGLGGFVTYPLAALFAGAGLLTGFFARGNLRVAGIMLNALSLVPAILLLLMVLGVLGAAGTP